MPTSSSECFSGSTARASSRAPASDWPTSGASLPATAAAPGPKVEGLWVRRTIKKDDNFKTIRVVILTSSREEKDLVESYKLGVNAYVVKPVDFQQFVDAVKELGAFWAVINEPPPGSATRTKK